MIRYTLLLICSVLCFTACTKNIDVSDLEIPEYEPEFALPLISLTSSVEDILEDTDPLFYSVDNSGLVTYVESDFSFEQADTFSVDLSQIDQSIKTMEYKFVIDNGVPVSGNLQLYFVDENKSIVDSLLTVEQKTIEPALVDVNGNVTTISSETIIIPFDEVDIDRVRSTKEMLLISTFYTNSNGNVFTNQEVSFRLGAKVIFDL